MLDESQSKIAELETKTRQLQARHDAFEAKLATSVDQQTAASRWVCTSTKPLQQRQVSVRPAQGQ